MAKIGIGRRITRATAAAVAMGSLFFVLGQVAIVAVPVLSPLLPVQLLAIGSSSAVLVELSSDVEATAKE